MSTTLNSTILSVLRRTKKGFTVGEIFDRVQDKIGVSHYSSVRARVYELANTGRLHRASVRRDTVSGRTATTFTR